MSHNMQLLVSSIGSAVQVTLCFLWGATVAAGEPAVVEPKIKLHAVAVPVESYRLLSMTRDDDGDIWTGSIHRTIHRYDPRAGTVESIRLPYDAVACSCICVGRKVYVLGQNYPRLIIFDRDAKTFSETAYPVANPDVWYGTDVLDGRHMFLFDRNGGVIRWDTVDDAGTLIPWPYDGPFPLGGRYEPRDNAVWCQSFDLTGGKYVPMGLSRFDLKSEVFTGWFPYPKSDDALRPMSDSQHTFFLPETPRGKLIPFDFAEGRWCRFLDVPGHGERFGFIGLGTLHHDRWYFSISTYDGDETGCDGMPYHFVNGLLEFDPVKLTCGFPMLEPRDVPNGPPTAYYQVAYTLSSGGEFFATGANIREADGTLNQAKAGEVVFWQTREK